MGDDVKSKYISIFLDIISVYIELTGTQRHNHYTSTIIFIFNVSNACFLSWFIIIQTVSLFWHYELLKWKLQLGFPLNLVFIGMESKPDISNEDNIINKILHVENWMLNTTLLFSSESQWDFKQHMRVGWFSGKNTDHYKSDWFVPIFVMIIPWWFNCYKVWLFLLFINAW